MTAPPAAAIAVVPYAPRGPVIAGTSSTLVTIGLTAQTFQLNEFGLGFVAGVRVRAASNGTPTQWMEGIVTSYEGYTLTINVDLLNGLGIYSDWNINVAGQPGKQGPLGPQGVKGDTGPSGGPPGPQGAAGKDGVNGAPGAMGPQGPQGTPGASGPIGPSYIATSTTSLAIGLGSKAFATQTSLAYRIGTRARAASASAPTNWMSGIVTTYISGTGSLTLNVDLIGGTGTFTDWNINVAGDPGGPVGPQGPPGPQGIPGAVGPAGLTGPAGPVGPVGPMGNQGVSGIQGPIGATGPAGPIGATGPQGAPGAVPEAPTDGASYARKQSVWISLDPTLNALAPIASPLFTGTPRGPTVAATDNSGTLATTAWVKTNLSNRPYVRMCPNSNYYGSVGGWTFVILNTVVMELGSWSNLSSYYWAPPAGSRVFITGTVTVGNLVPDAYIGVSIFRGGNPIHLIHRATRINNESITLSGFDVTDGNGYQLAFFCSQTADASGALIYGNVGQTYLEGCVL